MPRRRDLDGGKQTLGDYMCRHNWKLINDVYVCPNCGATRTQDGTVIFDRRLPNYLKNNGMAFADVHFSHYLDNHGKWRRKKK